MHRNILKDLIKPRRLDVEGALPLYGKFVAGPLERGYGTTIGNSLRRILLSSLPGAAITQVRIDLSTAAFMDMAEQSGMTACCRM